MVIIINEFFIELLLGSYGFRPKNKFLISMILSHNFNNEVKPIALAFGLHLAIFASLFSFTSASVDISNYTAAGSFSMMSFSDSTSGISEQKTTQVKKEQQTSQNPSQNSQNNNSDSSSEIANSEIIFDAKNLGNPQPQYPMLSKRRGEEGTVLVRAFVDASGIASKVEIFKSSSFSLLDDAALEAIKKWRFVPAKKFGQYITSSVIIPINFKLNQTL